MRAATTNPRFINLPDQKLIGGRVASPCAKRFRCKPFWIGLDRGKGGCGEQSPPPKKVGLGGGAPQLRIN